MALVRNNLSLRMKGRAGSFSFYSSKGRQVARVAQNSSNYGESARRSIAQQTRRVRWSNLVNFYRLMAGTLKGAFETKRQNETDYNAFMRKNLPIATVALTKDLAAKGCVVAQNFTISEGSLWAPKLSKEKSGSDSKWVSDILIGSPGDWGSKPVSEFVAAVLANNPWAKAGMQISVIALAPEYAAKGPVLGFERQELTLDPEDNRRMSTVWKLGSLNSNTEGVLNFGTLSTDSYVGIIISDSTSGQLKVSSSVLYTGDSEIEEDYSSDERVQNAIASYGVDEARFLDSGDLQ